MIYSSSLTSVSCVSLLLLLSRFNICKSLNELCSDDKWSIIKGNWDSTEYCSLTNTNSGSGNIIWFNNLCDEYDYDSFILSVEFSINSDTGDSGILFRGHDVSAINDGGQQYYIGLYPQSDQIIFGKMNNGWTPLHTKSYTINKNIKYKLKIVAFGSTYNIFIDNDLIFENIIENDYLSGSIGLRTYNAPSKYYSLTMQNANALCNSNDWNIIKGDWYEETDCTLINTDTASGNVIWFGSKNGDLPNCNYNLNSFILETEFSINSNNGDSGILFRAQTVSDVNDGGNQYYCGLYPASNQVICGKMDNGWNPLHIASYTIDPNIVYKFKIIADENGTYNIYIDNNLIFQNILINEYLSGSIGLRTFNAPSTYHSLSISSK